MQGSARVRGGKGTGRYRTVAYGAEVDESLFGGAGSARSGGALRNTGRRISGSRGSAAPATVRDALPVTAVLSRTELERIKASTVIKTREDIEREKAERQAALDATRAASKARKAHMLELEAKRVANRKLTVLEQEEKEAKEARVQLSAHQRDEMLDDVKTMTRKMRYAQTVAVRDRQVQEKKERELREKQADRVRDVEMELDRLRQIKTHKDREAQRREKLVKDRAEIERQIEYNRQLKIKEREAIREEQRQKKIEMEKQAEEEKLALMKESDRQRAHLAAVLAANEEAIRIKKKRKEDELEEDRKIVEYLKQEDAKRRAREEEEAAIKEAREMEIAKLRAMQEKEADKNAELDALRAKRAFEDGERALRRRQLAEAEKAKKRQQEMMIAREAQMRDQEKMMAVEARRQKAEFEANLKASEEEIARTRKEEHEVLIKNHKHKDDILSMINEREAEARERRREWNQRGEDSQKAIAAEVEAIRKIRDRKVEELLKTGVPERYTVELQKFDPEDALKKDYRLGGKIPTIS